MKSIIPALLLLLFAGCAAPDGAAPATRGPVTSYLPRVPWPEEEYANLAKKGANTVSGQAFMKTRGGDVKTAAGEIVMLNPVTTYSTQFVDVSILGKHEAFQELSPKDPDPRIREYAKQVTADATGRFTFYDVPAGEYYIYTLVRWEAPTGYGLQQQGGWVVSRVTVKDGDRNEFILTR